MSNINNYKISGHGLLYKNMVYYNRLLSLFLVTKVESDRLKLLELRSLIIKSLDETLAVMHNQDIWKHIGVNSGELIG